MTSEQTPESERSNGPEKETIASRVIQWPDRKVFGYLRGKSPEEIASLAGTIPNMVGRVIKDRFLVASKRFSDLLMAASDLEAAVLIHGGAGSVEQLPDELALPVNSLYDRIGAIAKQFFALADDYERELGAKENALADLVRKMGAQEKKYLEKIRDNKELYKAIMTDQLTGAYSRRFFFTDLPDHIRQAEKHNEPLSVILFDINDFKSVNDTYEHEGGDFVLKSMARFVRENLRAAYVLARLGGDEFGIIVPGAGEQDAHSVAENLRAKVEGHTFVYTVRQGNEEFDYGIQTTIALGIKEHDKGESADELYRGADAAFYVAHRLGKNRTVKYSEFLKHYQSMPSETTVRRPRNVITVRKLPTAE